MSVHGIDDSFICDIILSAIGAVSHDSGVALPLGFFFVLELGMTSELRRRRGETVTGTSGVATSVFALFLERRRDDVEVGAGGVAAWFLERRRVEVDAGGGLAVLVLDDEVLRRWSATEVLAEIVVDSSGSGVKLSALGELCRARFLVEPGSASASSTDCKVSDAD